MLYLMSKIFITDIINCKGGNMNYKLINGKLIPKENGEPNNHNKEYRVAGELEDALYETVAIMDVRDDILYAIRCLKDVADIPELIEELRLHLDEIEFLITPLLDDKPNETILDLCVN